ncbi:hypothetical protein NDU88_002514 [Pleurodeles waltl]|uniref:Uncharacterized protein n=1 Tax=Pleurodeles waltl TaxID=8319 RepID=A0AAV7M2P1_PLEWA|nr:hypothetical protein NDU88_002514 [Pleurodeles waltl]
MRKHNGPRIRSRSSFQAVTRDAELDALCGPPRHGNAEVKRSCLQDTDDAAAEAQAVSERCLGRRFKGSSGR